MITIRRQFLATTATLIATAAGSARLWAQPRFQQNPFTLGVASGYPQADGIVLWTRLAPDPLNSAGGGGMPEAAVEVAWEIAADDAFRDVLHKGIARAAPEYAHAVHAEIKRLAPARWYHYRFHAGGAVSTPGRFRTAPGTAAANDRLRFAIASCQQYEQGYYSAYRHMAREELDLVIHLGDYIYESSWGAKLVRGHGRREPVTLNEYRDRYALYKSDVDLQAAHAAAPWLVTWDDHEVSNDYANDRSQYLDPPAEFLERRAAAYQAYYEHMPLPAWARPRAGAMQLYMQAAFGQLARFYVLDSRQYRSHQVCPRVGRGGGATVIGEECPERLSPQLTLLGEPQEQWLHGALDKSATRWNIIAQQTLMAQQRRGAPANPSFWTDGWDGYPKARERLLGFIAERKVSNPLVVGGDIHCGVAADLKLNFDDEKSPVVASEFVGTSISSQGPSLKITEAHRQNNPHLKWMNGTRRGYAAFEVTPKHCTVRMRALSNVADPQATISDVAGFSVENGKAGVQQA
ncbi:MAG: alkaline phosphatase [Betaproteobacteria bacterium]|nr:alkaline phosphatase [Betaproteobacteria bacterium]